MTVQNRRSSGKKLPHPLPLFDWADHHEYMQLSLPERRIARKFRLTNGHAKIVAEFSGFNVEASS
jgi:hypothetical protein